MTYTVVCGNSVKNVLQSPSYNLNLILSEDRDEAFGGSAGFPRPDFQIRIQKRILEADELEGIGESIRLRGSWRSHVLQVVFAQVPAGVTLFVPANVFLFNSDRATSGRLRLIPSSAGGNPIPSAAEPLRSPNQLNLVEIRGYDGIASYEVLQCDDDVTEFASIPVRIAFLSNTSQNLPGLGQCTVKLRVAEPAPLDWTFRDVSACRNAFAVNVVSQSLLFPFVTNRMEFDTQVVISNTSSDPLGTAHQAGPVTLFFYGESGSDKDPPPIRSSSIPAGGQLVFTLSSGGNYGVGPLPDFQGYLIAVASFEYCHGVALIHRAGGSMSQLYKATRLKREPRSDPI